MRAGLTACLGKIAVKLEKIKKKIGGNQETCEKIGKTWREKTEKLGKLEENWGKTRNTWEKLGKLGKIRKNLESLGKT